MAKELQYKPCNWNNYNTALINRGSLTLWISEDEIANWLANNSNVSGSGKTKIYSDIAIECLNTLRFLLNMPLRAIQGFAESLFKLLNIDLPIPNYSTICRRLSNLECKLSNNIQKENHINIAIDSTGLKVYGEGEWKVRTHGYSKRRTWRKVHIAIDVNSQQIINTVVSTNDFKDNEVINDILDGIEQPIEDIYADGAYDAKNVYEAAEDKGSNVVVPPRKDAKIVRHGNSNKPKYKRDENLREIRKKGRKKWKKESHYHRRSLSETVMFRLKVAFGGMLKSRKFINCKTLDFI